MFILRNCIVAVVIAFLIATAHAVFAKDHEKAPPTAELKAAADDVNLSPGATSGMRGATA